MKNLKVKKDRETLKLRPLYELLKARPADKRPNLALLTAEEFLFCYRNKLSVSHFLETHGPVDGLRLARGPILDFFVQLEFMVNQIFVAQLAGATKDTKKIEQILDGVDFFQKTKLLCEWGLMDTTHQDLMQRLREVRNGLAHNWEIQTIKYKHKPLKEHFAKFKTDAAKVFDALIDLYNGHKVDIAELMAELKGS